MKKPIFHILLLVFCQCSSALAQGSVDKEATTAAKFGIASIRLNDFPSPNHYLVVDLSDPLDTESETQDLQPSNITVRFLPSEKVVPSSAINPPSTAPTASHANVADTNILPGFGDDTVQIGFLDGTEAKPEPGDDRVEITFTSLHFKKPGGLKSGVAGTGRIYNAANVSKLVEETREALKDAVAHAKTSEEKDIFVGFNISVPSGGGDSTEGNGDLHFNRSLYGSALTMPVLFDHLNLGFHLKKGSSAMTDPRHFELGLTLRKTFLRADRSSLQAIANAIHNINPTSPSTTLPKATITRDGETVSDNVVQLINELQRDFVRAFLFDNALRFEGEVTNTGINNVSNLLYDSQLQVATVSQAFAGQTGFWNFRFMPVGLEVGGNVSNGDNAALTNRSLVRLKTGAVLNLIFKAKNPSEPVGRIEFEAKAVDRYLFRNEIAFDEATQMALLTDRGNKYWVQVDAKVFTGLRAGKGRLGFRVSFSRGFLPPVYAFTNAFNFGLVFETSDDDSSGDSKD